MVSEAHGSERFARHLFLRAERFNDLQVTAALYSRLSPKDAGWQEAENRVQS
jgi:hypothetical protein